MSFQPYIVIPSPIIQQYASTSAATTAIPPLNDLLVLKDELQNVQEDLSARKSKLEQDAETLRNWSGANSKAKGKEKQKQAPALQQSQSSNSLTSLVQTPTAPLPDKKVIAKAKRESSIGASSVDLSDADSAPSVRKKKDPTKKRKRKKDGVIPGSDDDEYSGVERSASEQPQPPSKSQPVTKARKTLPNQSVSSAALAALPSFIKNTSKPTPPPPPPPPSSSTVVPVASSSAASSPAVPLAATSSSTSIQAPPQNAPSPSATSSQVLKLKMNGITNSPAPPSALSGSISKRLIDSPAASPSTRKSVPTPLATSDDFALPFKSLVPPMPISVPPKPLPRTQQDVTEDFSKVKVGTQTPFTTFLSSVDPYLRNYGEDDVAWLSQKSEDLTPFIIPALGKHYAEVWQDEDSATPPPSGLSTNSAHLAPPPLERFRAEDVTDDKLPTEGIYLGPIAERLVAALSAEGLLDVEGEKLGLDEGDMDVDPGSPSSQPVASTSATPYTTPQPNGISQANGPLASQSQSQPAQFPHFPMDAIELEERVRKELRYLGVFPSNPEGPPGNKARDGDIDWTSRMDDDISSALRACQRSLSQQIAINESRKAILVDKVNDRMAYQEYETLRDGLEKTIETGWVKRLRQGTKKKVPTVKEGKQKEKEGSSSQAGGSSGTTEKRIPLSDSLLAAIDKRRRFVDGLAPIFQDAPPGRFRHIPPASVYEADSLAAVPPNAIEEEVERLVKEQG